MRSLGSGETRAGRDAQLHAAALPQPRQGRDAGSFRKGTAPKLRHILTECPSMLDDGSLFDLPGRTDPVEVARHSRAARRLLRLGSDLAEAAEA